MKFLMRSLLLLTLILAGTDSWARGCNDLKTFLDLALNQRHSITQAGEIENRLHTLIEAGSEVRVLEGGNYVEARVLRYEDGSVVYAKQDGTEIVQQIDDEFNNFFRLASEIPPETSSEVVAGLPAVVPDNGGGSLSLSTDTAVGVDRTTPTRVEPSTEVDRYVYDGEIVEPGTGVVRRDEPAGLIDDETNIIDLGPEDYQWVDDAAEIADNRGGTPLIEGNPNPDALPGPDTPIAIEGPGNGGRLALPPPSGVTASDIPDAGRFVTFTTTDGRTMYGRIVGEPNGDGVRMVVRGDSRTGDPTTISFESIEPGSLRTITEAGAPYQIIRRPVADEIPAEGTVFTYTSPKRQNSYTARVVGEPADGSVVVERMTPSGELERISVSYQDMRAESITPLGADDIPDAFTPSGPTTGTALVPYDENARAVAVVDGGDPAATGPGTGLALTDGRDVTGTGTAIEPRVLDGEVLDPENAVVPGTRPAGALEREAIDGEYTVIDDAAEALTDGRQLALPDYSAHVRALPSPQALAADDFFQFYNGSLVRFTADGRDIVGRVTGVEDGRIVVSTIDGQTLVLDPATIARGDIDVFNLNRFSQPDADLVFYKENLEPFTGPFGAIDPNGVRLSDDDIMDALREGSRFDRLIDGYYQFRTRAGQLFRIPRRILESEDGITMANRIGDLRLNFHRAAQAARAGLVTQINFDWLPEWARPEGMAPPAPDAEPLVDADPTPRPSPHPEATPTQTPTPTPTPEATPTPTPTPDPTTVDIGDPEDGGEEAGEDVYNQGDDDDDDDDDETPRIRPAPRGNPVRPQLKAPPKLKIIRTRGVY